MHADAKSVRSVRYMGLLPRMHTDLWTLLGQDGGQSIEAGDRTVFVFSDTLLSSRARSRPVHAVPAALRSEVGSRGVFLANCAGTSSARGIREAFAAVDYFRDEMGFPREILPATAHEAAREIRFWPLHGLFHRGHVYLYFIGIQTVDASTIWGFRNIGCGLARLDPLTGDCERISANHDWRLWRRGPDLHFGVQLLRDGDDCYVFGSVRDGLWSRALLARVHVDHIDEPAAYSFLRSTAPDWSPSIDEALDLGPCASDYSVSWNAHLGRYLMLYVDSYRKLLTMRTAEHPWGPYSAPSVVTAVPHARGSEMVYLGFEHPAFTPDDGKTVFLSYSQPHFTNNSLLALRFR